MVEHLFPDNTVLCNFAAVERLDLLRSALGGRGRWTEAVAYEASRSSVKLPALGMLPLEGWLGEPIEVSDPADIGDLMLQMAALDRRPRLPASPADLRR